MGNVDDKPSGKGQSPASTTENAREKWLDLISDFSGPAIVVETAEAPRFHVTWGPGEKRRLIEYFVEALDQIEESGLTLDEERVEDETSLA